MSISDYLIRLTTLKNNLSTTLTNKGINVGENPTLSTLVPQVDEIGVDRTPFDKVLYSFGVLSDIHLKDSNFGNDDNLSLQDYQKALTFFKNSNVDFVAIAGDIVANNRTSTQDIETLKIYQNEWVSELNIFKQHNQSYFPDKPVYTTIGNHDANPNGFYVAYTSSNADTEGLNVKIIADGYDGTKTGETVWTEIIGRPINYVIEHNGDVFIFFSMYYWYYAKFCRDSDIDWLEAQIASHSDKRIFLFFHLPLRNTFEFTNNSSVFDDNKSGFQSNIRMGNIIRNNKNIVWFSGHTHYDLELESQYPNANIYQNGNSAIMVHCSSGTVPRLPNGDSYHNVSEGSQGYLVDVYADKIVVKGIDFADDKSISKAQYIINTK